MRFALPIQRKPFAPLKLFLGVIALLALSGCPVETGNDQNSGLPLASPGTIQITARDGALLVQWTRVVALQQVDPTYTVYYGTTSNPEKAEKWREGIAPDTTNLVTETITGLQNHQLYFVWATCTYGSFGESSLCPTAYGTPVPPPPSVENLTIDPGDGMLQISWTALEDAFEYAVHFQKGASSLTTPPSETDEDMKTVSVPGVMLLGLESGATYTLWVKAINTAGESPSWTRGTGIPRAATGIPSAPPSNLTITPGNNKLVVAWDPVRGVPEYKVWYSDANDFSAATALEEAIPTASPTVSAEINGPSTTGLSNGTLYYVWVKSSNSIGVSTTFATASGTPEAKPPIDRSNHDFVIGYAAGTYPWAQNVPPSSLVGPDGWPGRDRLTRVQETALGDMYTDGALWYFRKTVDPNIDFALLNGSFIEGFLQAGQTITVFTMILLNNPGTSDRPVFISMKGDKLKLLFDRIADVVHTGRGSSGTGDFGMVSKEVRYTIQYPRAPEGTEQIPSEEREVYLHGRIREGTLKIHGEPVDDNRTYYLVTTTHVMNIYLPLIQYGTYYKPTGANPFFYAVEEYIYDKVYITPYLDGRIKLEGGVPLPPPWTPGDWVLE